MLSTALGHFVVELWCFVIIMAVFASVLSAPWLKGWFGEFVVDLSLKSGLDRGGYKVFKNVTLPTESGSTQIDHIVVAKSGVFVIETKCMKGWIFGGLRQKTWTQSIWGRSYKFQNPLRQNFKHVKTLERLLGLDERQIHSVVVFVGDCRFKTDMPENVVYGGALASHVKSKNAPVLSERHVSRIVDQLERVRLRPSLGTRIRHVRHVRGVVARKSDRSDPPNCPKCGRAMVMRRARRGKFSGRKFWGCPDFPACRGIMEAE